MPSAHLCTFALLVIFLSISARVASAQGPAVSDGGTKPFGSYSGGSFDTVNNENGQLIINYPFSSPPQRGKIKLNYNLAYQNVGYEFYVECPPSVGEPTKCNWSIRPSNARFGIQLQTDIPSVVFKTSIPTDQTDSGSYYQYTSYSIVDSTFTSHAMVYDGSAYHAIDGSGYQYIYSGSNPSYWPDGSDDETRKSSQSGTVIDRDGNQYEFEPQLEKITDVDGNYVTFGTSGTDTMGRPLGIQTTAISTSTNGCPDINAQYQPLSGSATWTLPGYGGTISYLVCYANLTIATNITPSGGAKQYSSTQQVIQSIVQPDGTYWGFNYRGANPDDPTSVGYGDLQTAILPTGATIQYSWTTYAPRCSNTPSPATGVINTIPDAVQSRTVNHDGLVDIWNYAYQNTISSNSAVTTVTDPQGNQTVHTFSDESNGYCNLYETKAEYKQNNSGTLSTLETVTNTYQPQGSAEPDIAAALLKSTAVTWANGQSSTTSNSYDSGYHYFGYVCQLPPSGPHTYSCQEGGQTGNLSYGLPISTSTYNYDGSLINQTTTQYRWQGVGGSSYLQANLLNTPSLVTTYDSTGQISQATNSYDESGNVGLAPSQAINTQTGAAPNSVYGHITTTVNWLNSGGSNPSTSTYWLNTGMVDHVKDPRGNNTYYVYGAAYDGAFLTQTTNALGQSTSWAYDSNTGSKTYETTPDGSSSWTYDDMNRLTCSIDSTGAATGYTYNPTGYAANSVLTVSPEAGKSCNPQSGSIAKTLSLYDQLGRPIETDLLSDPAGKDITKKSYDSLGRLASVTNPYRTTGDSSYGVTTYGYDMVGRQTSITHSSDGTSQTTSYSGNQATMKDETGREWIRTTDAAGRLVQVLEPDGSTNVGAAPTLETDYQYDGNANLTQVNQWGGPANSSTGERVRVFKYDSLSRLIYSCNPETIPSSSSCTGSGPWSDQYSYDSAGNVTSRIAFAPNVPASSNQTVTTSYTYDSLNRVTSKSYSDGSTLPVQFTYDARMVTAGGESLTLAYPVGRLVQTCVVLGTTCQSQTTYDYVETGGIRYLYRGYNPQSTSTFGYTRFVYPVDGWYLPSYFEATVGPTGQINYSYDGAGHLTSAVTTMTEDATHPSVIFQASSYGPIGLLNGQLGINSSLNQAAINSKKVYDGRMRLQSETDTDSNFQTEYSYSSSFDGNGNVIGVDDSVNGSWTYGYDNLNRLLTATLATASQYGGTPYPDGAQAIWYYDAFGNRGGQATVGGLPSVYTDFDPPYNNQMRDTNFTSSVTYDGAGNVLSDGLNNYAYDAEGRLCATQQLGYPFLITGYVYNAEGNRIAKGALSSLSCNIASNGFQLLTQYIPDKDGNEVYEYTAANQWVHTNVFYNGKLIVTYDKNGSHYNLTDGVNTRRVQVSPGSSNLAFASLPFGDDLTPPNSSDDATAEHFTGKERDTESGLDYFGARHYSSNMGRFMSPDPSGLYYADPSNPQSLNLYSYVQNNPLTSVDPNGLRCVWDDQSFDSETDPLTSAEDGSGGHSACTDLGGTWYDPGTYASGADWGSSNADGTLQLHGAAPSESVTVTGTAGGAISDTSLWTSGYIANVGLGIANVFNYLTGQKQVPYYRYFMTHHCGPGGDGPTTGVMDKACKTHDDCFDNAHLDASVNIGTSATVLNGAQVAAAAKCNQALYNAARANPDAVGSTGLRLWLTQSLTPFGAYILYPKTQAKAW